MTTRIGTGAKVHSMLGNPDLGSNPDKKPKDRTKSRPNPKSKFKKRSGKKR